jgi:hypothetical protein
MPGITSLFGRFNEKVYGGVPPFTVITDCEGITVRPLIKFNPSKIDLNTKVMPKVIAPILIVIVSESPNKSVTVNPTAVLAI